MAPVESLYARTSYSQIPHRDEILTILKWARIHTPIHQVKIQKDGRFLMYMDGFQDLIGVDGKEVSQYIYGNKSEDKITLLDLLLGAGFGLAEIKGWNSDNKKYGKRIGVSEDAISIILFYFANFVQAEEAKERARIVCDVIKKYGIRPLLESVCMRAAVRFFPSNNSPEPLDLHLLSFISLVNAFNNRFSIDKVRDYVHAVTGYDPYDGVVKADISIDPSSCFKSDDIKLRTNDLWFDHEMKSYISFYGLSVLTGLKRSRIEGTLQALHEVGYGCRGAVDYLNDLAIPKEHIDKWIEIGVIPGDMLVDLVSAFSISDKNNMSREIVKSIEKHGTIPFLLSKAVIGMSDNKTLVPMPKKTKHEYYIQAYTIRYVKSANRRKPLSKHTLWMGEDDKYRMSWNGIEKMLKSTQETLRKMLFESASTDGPSLRADLYRIGYTDNDIECMLTKKEGVPEDAIELIIRHYCRIKGHTRNKAAAVLSSIEQHGIRTLLDAAVAKTLSANNEYVPVRKTKKQEEIAKLKYGDVH